MLVSLVGFAMMSGGRSNSQGESTQLSDIPFQQMTDQTSGQVFWGARLNGEDIIFLNIDQYKDREDLKTLAEQIGQQSTVRLSLDESFSSSTALFYIEKALRGRGISYTKEKNLSCDSDGSNILFLTSDAENKDEQQGCMVFYAKEGEADSEAEGLSYYLVSLAPQK